MLPVADFRQAHLTDIVFVGADLNSANFESATLDCIDPDALDRQNPYMTHEIDYGARTQSLRCTSLDRGSLLRANFDKAILNGVQMKGANLRFASMKGSELTEVQLQGATLEDGKLDSIVILDSNLQGTDLNGPSMRGAYLR